VKIKTNSGIVLGKVDKGIFSFKGIPYAEPPIGSNRWLPPKSVSVWQGVKDCFEYGPICPQNELAYDHESAEIGQAKQSQSEDCLTLNIWTPEKNTRKIPVMVWIHGGAFWMGSGDEEVLNPDNICRNEEFVVVSINYRLACFGFLRLADITNGKIPSSGCEALLDQIEALKWIKENIAFFGGDEKNISVIGQSAGGHSISTLISMPAARGLFHKAIILDGGSECYQPKEESNRLALKLLKEYGIKPNEIDKINSLTTEQLKAFDAQLQDPNSEFSRLNNDFATQAHAKPCIDGEHIPIEPLEAIRQGSAKGIEVILGTSDDEAFGFDEIFEGLRGFDLELAAEEELKDWIRKSNYLDIKELSAKQQIKALLLVYQQHLKEKELDDSIAEAFMKLNGHKYFWISTVRLAEALSRHSENIYNFVWTFPGPYGSPFHSSSLPFFLGWNNTPAGKLMSGEGPEVEKVSEFAFQTLDAFMKSGNPLLHFSDQQWPSYGKDRYTLVIDKEFEVVNDFNSSLREAWEKVEPRIPGNL
jgi:para-nitrobenzyl esterase